MNKCPNCDNKLSNIDVLCPRCGALVEVVQIKNHNPGNSSNAVLNNQKITVNPKQIKEEDPSLIVYNDDSPIEKVPDEKDLSLGNMNIVQDEKQAVQNLTNDFRNDNDEDNHFSSLQNINLNNDSYAQPDDTLPAKESIIHPQYITDDSPVHNIVDNTDISSYDEDPLPKADTPSVPESDDLDGFDPEEFMREYRRNKSKKQPIPVQDDPEQYRLQHRTSNKEWLEIEEAENEPAPPDVIHIPQTAEPLDDSNMQKRQRQPKDVSLKKNVKTSTTKRKTSPVLLIILFWVVLAGAFYGAFLLFDLYVTNAYGEYNDFVFDITKGQLDMDTNAAYQNNVNVSISKTQSEDHIVHLFNISTIDGVQVKVLPLNQIFDLTDGNGEFIIPDYMLAKSLNIYTHNNSYTTNDVNLEIITDKRTYTYPISDLELMLDNSEYARQQPVQSLSSTFEEYVEIDVVVVPGTSVFINDIEYSDLVDERGTLSINESLVLGENKFIIEIVQPGKKAREDTFTVTRQIPYTTLIPDTDYLRIYNDTFTCYGTTDANTVISAQIDENNFDAKVDGNGKFSLLCTVEEYGLHYIQITATSDNTTDATTTIAVELLPELNAFMAEAMTHKTDDIIAHGDTLQSIPIIVAGNVRDISLKDKTLRFTLYSDDGELPCYYHGMETLEEDAEYTAFGMFDAVASSFYAMYIS